MVIPALSLFAGSPGQDMPFFHHLSLCTHLPPGRFVEDLPESTQEKIEAYTKQYYSHFQPFEERERKIAPSSESEPLKVF
jgi:dynactin-5